MSVHPEFDEEKSGCMNCAAFQGTVIRGVVSGTCHRFAPRSAPSLLHFAADHTTADDHASTEPRDYQWPYIEDEWWCMDWFPSRKTTIPVVAKEAP